MHVEMTLSVMLTIHVHHTSLLQYIEEIFCTVLTRVEEMLAEVAAEHSFFQDSPLLQLLFGGSGLHEGAQKAHQLAMFLGHCQKGATES